VVVTLNHRLGAFGYTHLTGADSGIDARFADAGNAGMLDIVAALRWVRDHADAFGGDAGNVTIFGQSGGGSKVGAASGGTTIGDSPGASVGSAASGLAVCSIADCSGSSVPDRPPQAAASSTAPARSQARRGITLRG